MYTAAVEGCVILLTTANTNNAESIQNSNSFSYIFPNSYGSVVSFIDTFKTRTEH